ncbi:MAG: hypothetical protein ACREYF_10290 [Gammaproteobacteria bacterium]
MSTKDIPKRKDRHRLRSLQLRIDPLFRQQLKILALRESSTVTDECQEALRKHLERKGLWPIIVS